MVQSIVEAIEDALGDEITPRTVEMVGRGAIRPKAVIDAVLAWEAGDNNPPPIPEGALRPVITLSPAAMNYSFRMPSGILPSDLASFPFTQTDFNDAEPYWARDGAAVAKSVLMYAHELAITNPFLRSPMFGLRDAYARLAVGDMALELRTPLLTLLHLRRAITAGYVHILPASQFSEHEYRERRRRLEGELRTLATRIRDELGDSWGPLHPMDLGEIKRLAGERLAGSEHPDELSWLGVPEGLIEVRDIELHFRRLRAGRYLAHRR